MQKEQKVQLGLLFVLETMVKILFFVSFFNRFQNDRFVFGKYDRF